MIDLYQSHDDDPSTPMAETMQAFAELIRSGKVRAIGASNFTAPRLAEALRVSAQLGLPSYESLQPLYNPIDRSAFEAELEPLCRAQGIGVMNFYGLAAGFSTTGQVALAWQIAKPAITAPIASATSPAQLHELAGAVRVPLGADDIAKIDAASAA